MLKKNFRSVIKETCRNLRKNQTKAESVLWEVLRNRKFEGLKFYRQHPFVFEYEKEENFCFFVADFYCRERKLVLELDGGVHKKHGDKDALRTELLAVFGVRVVRFRNEMVLNDLDNVLKEIKRNLF